jgi:hypothetical protein
MKWLLRLYPARWRARYGDEFLALLEGQPRTLDTLLDVILGALDAHLRPQLGAREPTEGSLVMDTRRVVRASGPAATLVGVLFLALTPMEALVGRESTQWLHTLAMPMFWLLVVIFPLIAVALIGLHARQGRQVRRAGLRDVLQATAALGGGIAGMALVTGLVVQDYGAIYQALDIGVFTLWSGLLLLGPAAWAARVLLPRWTALALALLSVLNLVVITGGTLVYNDTNGTPLYHLFPQHPLGWLRPALLLGLGLSWLALGSALRVTAQVEPHADPAQI